MLWLAVLWLAGAGCHQRVAVDSFPPGVLRVRYVQADSYSDCLVASAVMCANYVTASQRFNAAKLGDELTAAGLDPTRIADVQSWLEGRRLAMQALAGTFSDDELTGLGWWLLQGGYPVICVMNKFGGNADYNHAVVVIGVGGGGGDSVASAKEVYFLDPASAKRVERLDRLTFLHYWGSAGNIMLPLFEDPQQRKGSYVGVGASR